MFEKYRLSRRRLDRYDLEQSIKSAERDRRSSSCSSFKVFQVIDGRQIPDWKKFLGVGENKQALIRFLGESIVQHHDRPTVSMTHGEVIFLAGTSTDPISVTKICSEGVFRFDELFCTHEEADTRMILHAIHADKVFGVKGIKGRIIMKSPDTDVLIVCVHYFPSMQHTHELWFQTGTITCT